MSSDSITDKLSFLVYKWESLGTAVNLAFDLLPMTLVFLFLKDSDNELLIPTLAMTVSCYNYFFGYLISFQECISIHCVPFFSDKKPKDFANNFYRLILIDLMFLAFSIALVLVSEPILVALNIDPTLAKATSILLMKTLVAKIIENFNNVLKGLLIAQDLFKNIHLLNLVAAGTFTLALYISTHWYHMELDAYVIAFTVKTIAELIFISALIFLKVDKTYLQRATWSGIKQGFCREILFVITIVFTTYIEIAAYFIAFVILAQLKNNKVITAYTIFIDQSQYTYLFQLGYTTYIRTQLLLAAGQKDREEYVKVRRKLFLYSFGSLVFLISAWLLLFPKSTRLYTNKRSILEYVNMMCFMDVFNISTVHFLVIFSSLLKMINKERLQLTISLALFVPLYVILQAVLVLVIPLNVFGCRVAAQLAHLVYAIVAVIVYFHYEKQFLDQLGYAELGDDSKEATEITENKRK